MSCGIVLRLGLDPKLMWLWYRSAAIALIQPLAWEPPYAAGLALKRQKEKKEKKKKRDPALPQDGVWDVAVAQSPSCCGCGKAGSYSSSSTPSLGISVCAGTALKSKKQKKSMAQEITK